MKKIVFVSLFALTAFTGIAQNKIKFGVKAGANFATWTGQQAQGIDLRPGFHAGGLMLVPLTSTLSIKPEIFFSSEGASMKPYRFAVNYIRIPLLVEYQHAGGFLLETGPQLGYELSAKRTGNNDDADIEGQLPKLEASWGLGAGYRHKSGAGFSLRYNFGISDLGTEEYPLKSSVISAGISYIIGGR